MVGNLRFCSDLAAISPNNALIRDPACQVSYSNVIGDAEGEGSVPELAVINMRDQMMLRFAQIEAKLRALR